MPRPGFEQLAKGGHVERLFYFDIPDRSVAQLGPLDHRTGDVHHVLHGSDVRQTVFDEGRDRLVGIPRADGRNFEGRTQTVNEQADGTAVLASAKQFHDGAGLWLTFCGDGRGAVSAADNPHASIH